MKVVVSGLGRISWGYHLPQLAERSDFELLAVADPMADRCREAVEKFKVPRTYADCGEMIAKERDADLLVLTSPTCFHADQAVYALEHGVDVFCEKPLAGNLAEAERMVAAMRRNGRRMMVFQPHRVRPETDTLLEILRSGLLGRALEVMDRLPAGTCELSPCRTLSSTMNLAREKGALQVLCLDNSGERWLEV